MSFQKSLKGLTNNASNTVFLSVDGRFQDIKIFSENSVHQLLDDDRVLADEGYSGEYVLNKNTIRVGLIDTLSKVLARHEVVNGKIKKFKITSERFRYNISKRSVCLHAVSNIVQSNVSYYGPRFFI